MRRFVVFVFVCFLFCSVFVFSVPSVRAYTGTITYNAGTYTITAVGGSSSTPITFNDVYQASVAGGWGVVTLQGSNQYAFSCSLQIGDDSNYTFFADSGKQLILSNGAWSGFIYVKDKAFVTFGLLDNEALMTTTSGCQFIVLDASFGAQFIGQAAAGTNNSVRLYSCSFNGLGGSIHYITLRNGRIWNCQLGYSVPLAINSGYSGGGVSVFNNRFEKLISSSYNHVGLSNTPVLCEKLFISGVGNGFSSNLPYNLTLKNFYVRNCTKLGYLGNGFTANVHCVNFDVDIWSFTWQFANVTGKVYRQYEFDLSVLNGEVTEFVEDANVTLTKNDVVIGSWLTNSSGQIPVQVLTYGYYNQANGDALQDSTDPFVMTVVHDDWATYTSRFYVTEKTKMTISMQEEVSITPDPSVYMLVEESEGDFVVGLVLVGVFVAVFSVLVLVAYFGRR